MSGKMSRDKGKRNEYLLRDALRMMGWKADRVPSSGAAQGFPGDIKASRDGKDLLFELKARKDTFKMIYALYAEQISTQKDDVLAVAIPGGEKLCVAVSSSLDAVLGPVDLHSHVEHHPLFKKYKRTFAKIGNLQKLLGQADILAIKDNNKPFLYLRFR